MSIDLKRVRTLFHEATEQPDPSARAAFLDRECGSDVALRQNVDALVNAFLQLQTQAVESPAENNVTGHTGADLPESKLRTDHQLGTATGTYLSPNSQATTTGEFQQSGVTVTFADTSFNTVGHVHSMIGTVIGGRYTLMELLGEGGMGSVYMADQTEPIRRQVAIKLIKSGMDSKSVLIRFDSERQALAVMDHPNIARIYDGGVTSQGQPFFVMELVRGVTLTTYCDRNLLSVDARLQLFVAVCQAVQHAHQKGIIHRDLKPSNVMVTELDGRPTPKVIDFGVAKAIDQKFDEMSFTEAGVVVGTPTYMSPEQADPALMDIDTRTDVYALGVMLYELLTGSTPIDRKLFKRGAMYEMLRMVREIEPPRPSTKLSKSDELPGIAAKRSIEPAKLSKLLQGELDWVVMKAIEKDRTRRYDSASGFAQDIQKYLADEVVDARPPSTGYRLRKFIRRHKRQVAVAATFVLALGIALSIMAVLAVTADTERKRAERNFDTASNLAYELSDGVAKLETGLANQGQSDLQRRAALDSASATFDQLRAERPNDKLLQRQAADLHRYAGNVSRLTNASLSADKSYKLSIRILEQLVESDPQADSDRDKLALALSDYGTFQKRLGQLKEATQTYIRAAAIAKDLKDRIRASSYQRTMGLIELGRADVEYRKGDFVAAEAASQRAADLWDALKTAPEAEQTSVDRIFAAYAHLERAMALRELGRYPEAMKLHDDVVARSESLGGEKGKRDVIHLSNKAKLERLKTRAKMGEKRDVIVTELTALLAPAERLAAEYSTAAIHKEVQVEVLLLRAEAATALGKPEPVLDDLNKAKELTGNLLKKHANQPDHIGLRASAYSLLGRVYLAEKNIPDAINNFDLAVQVYKFAVTGDPDHIRYQRGLEEAKKELQSAKKNP